MLHEQGVIHRDIKPSNIRVVDNGQPVLLDFGLARNLQGQQQTLTGTYDILGTPGYMAPEQIGAHGSKVDARTDVFALGVTLYELLTGKKPFQGVSLEQTLQAILKGEYPAPSQWNQAIEDDLAVILGTCLDFDPAGRYINASELADDLQRFLERRPIKAKPASISMRVRRWFLRSPALGSALFVIAFGLVGGLVLTLVLLSKVTEERDFSERKATEYGHLAAARSLDDLQAVLTPSFWRADPERIPAITAWLESARDLTGTLPVLRQTRKRMSDASRPGTGYARGVEGSQAKVLLDELRMRQAALLGSPEEPGASQPEWESVRDWLDQSIAKVEGELSEGRAREFDLATDAWHFGQLELLIGRLEELEMGGEGSTGIPDVQALLARCHTIQVESLDLQVSAWSQAAQRVSQDPRFQGFPLGPRLGLIPLGPDLQTGFEEFALFGTGPCPERLADGQLDLSEQSAVIVVLLPGGSYTMGASDGDPYAVGNETRRTVGLTPFFLGKHEVTQAQWRAVMGSSPSAYPRDHPNPPNLISDRNPVESVSWLDSVDFSTRLGLDLPTEAQWEYACRAGTAERFAWGEALTELNGRENVGDESLVIPGFEPAPWNDGFIVHAPVGTFQANPFGLYDMHGNVSEWTRDRMRPAPLDPILRQAGSGLDLSATRENRIFRGGSWYTSPRFARSSMRNHMDPESANATTGMRLALDWTSD